MQSSKSPRALDSAQAFLQGFCPFDSIKVTPYCPAVLPSIGTSRGDPVSLDSPISKNECQIENF